MPGLPLHLASFFYPLSCYGCGSSLDRGLLCPACFTRLETPGRDDSFSPPLFAAARYAGAVREAVMDFKYRGQAWLARPLAGLVAGRVSDSLPPGVACLVPVPLHPVRRRERGYDQARLLAGEFGRIFSLPVAGRLLLRPGWSPPQASLAGRRRRNNVSGVFRASSDPGEGPAGKCLLVDDVATTGATLGECRRTLEKAGFTVAAAICVARAFE